MIAKKVQAILEEGRGISQMFGDAAQMIAELGAENVYNISIGNPSVEPPEAVKEAIIEELNTQKPMALHSYTGGLVKRMFERPSRITKINISGPTLEPTTWS